MALLSNNKHRQGFTLIELLVVISIIGVLASVVLASLNSARDKALIAKAQSEVRTLYTALIRYNLDTGGWPALNCNSAIPAETNIYDLPAWNGAWKNEYLPTIGNDPWGVAYYFDGCPDVECLPGHSAICSGGPNKTIGSFNRADMIVQSDDICIYFEPEC